MNIIEYKGIVAFHPGYYIKSYLDEEVYTKEELTEKLGLTPKQLHDLLNGKMDVNWRLAEKLSQVFGTSATMWTNLNAEFNRKHHEIKKMRAEDRKTRY